MATSREATEALGGKITNLLDEDDVLFQSLTGAWTATNGTLSAERTLVFRSQYQTLKVTPSVVGSPTTDVSLTHTPITVGSSFLNDYICGVINIYTLNRAEVAVTVSSNEPSTTSTTYIEVPAETWVVVRSPDLAVPAVLNKAFSMTIDVKLYGTPTHFHIAHPVLVNSYGFTDNQFLRESIIYMPQFLLAVDSEQTDPSFPMSRMMDIGLTYANVGFEQSINFPYRDTAGGYVESDDSTKSTLVDPDSAEPRFLPWLAQFVGIQLESVIAGSTPWGNLPSTWENLMEDIDPAADISFNISSVTRDGSGVVTATLTTSPTTLSIGDTVSVRDTVGLDGQFVLTDVNTGTNTVEWAQDGSATTETVGNITVVDSSWIEIEAFNRTDSSFVESRRFLVSSARTGINSGSKQSLEDAISFLLSGTQAIRVFSDPIGSPWQIFVETLTSETPGGQTGVESDILIVELQKVRPMGFLVSHECVASF